jgi:hypothetical protein
MGGDHFPMFRFFTPVIAICAALLVWLIRQIDQGLKRTEATMTVLTLAMIVLSLNAFAFKYVGGAAVAQEGWMADRWSEVGRWFKANTEPDTSIAVGVVGAIPYYADLKTYDTLGLTNREVGTQGQTHLAGRPGHQKYNTAYLLAEKPDYIIFGISGLLPEPVGIDSISQDYDYAVYDFAHHDATAALYEYQVIELDSGYYIEVLALKEN